MARLPSVPYPFPGMERAIGYDWGAIGNDMNAAILSYKESYVRT